jgi:CRP-like cAMP-binding protein
MDYLKQLRKCQLCSELAEDELKALSGIASYRHLAKGEILFLQGDTATGFYVLLSGGVRVYKASADGREYTMHFIRPGQMFAEAAIFRGTEFPANCAALETSEVAFFPKDRFLDLIRNSPQISLKMIGGMAGFVREFNRMVEDLSLKDVPARLAAFLLDEYRTRQGTAIHLDIPKAELARKLGTVSETLSRNLRRLQDLGMIRVEGKNIEILDSMHLQSVAEGEKV